MIHLQARIDKRWNGEPFVAHINKRLSCEIGNKIRERYYLLHNPQERVLTVYQGSLTNNSSDGQHSLEQKRQEFTAFMLPRNLEYLADGDVVLVYPKTGNINVLYRKSSSSNSLFLTEQCNNKCIMCCQPPKRISDEYLYEAYLNAIPLMSDETVELGITGGEPTLLKSKFTKIVSVCKHHLPNTSLHILSNARMFNYLSFCQELSEVQHPDLMIGVPLNSDIAGIHDYIVQSKGAFDQTIRGILNLARCNIRIEIRIILNKLTVNRLYDIAQFIVRNFPFVEHIALMGMEIMGYAKRNIEILWIDPFEYNNELKKAVTVFQRSRLKVSIFNHQLCVLDQDLWHIASKSISDWKNIYLKICNNCSQKMRCGGFFSSSRTWHSKQIRPLYY